MGCPNELYKLISEGDNDTVVKYMERHKMTPKYFLHYNLKLKDEEYLADTYCPVAEAAKQGQLNIMNTLIEGGFDPDSKDVSVCNYDRGPIQCACHKGHLHVVKCLIEDHNVNVNSTDECDDLPLSIAMQENHMDIAKYLIESGASVTNSAVHECIRWCDSEMVEYILSKGVDVNARDLYQMTPLFETVRCCDPYSSALLLLDAGADVDAEDEVGSTTFLQAAQEQDIELMRLLISRGADPNVVNNYGNTALHCALYGTSLVNDVETEVIKYLVVELGLECLNTRNSRGLTPVAVALKNGCDKIVFELLVNYGCNITDEFDLLDDDEKQNLEKCIHVPNCTEFFQHLKQCTSQPRSLQDLASLKLRRHLGVHLETAVRELPLPEILKDLVKMNMEEEEEDDDDDDDDEEDEDEEEEGVLHLLHLEN